MEQFIIFLLGYVSIILSGLFAMKSLPSIPTATVIGIIGAIAAAVAAYAAVVLLWKQEARWEYEDRPRVEASEFRIEADNLIWLFTNVGKEDATQVIIRIATIDIDKPFHRLETTPDAPNEFVRLKPGARYSLTTPIEATKLLRFLVACTKYSNINKTFRDPAKFYYSPPLPLRPMAYPASPVAPLDDEKLSLGFSCSKL